MRPTHPTGRRCVGPRDRRKRQSGAQRGPTGGPSSHCPAAAGRAGPPPPGLALPHASTWGWPGPCRGPFAEMTPSSSDFLRFRHVTTAFCSETRVSLLHSRRLPRPPGSGGLQAPVLRLGWPERRAGGPPPPPAPTPGQEPWVWSCSRSFLVRSDGAVTLSPQRPVTATTLRGRSSWMAT